MLWPKNRNNVEEYNSSFQLTSTSGVGHCFLFFYHFPTGREFEELNPSLDLSRNESRPFQSRIDCFIHSHASSALAHALSLESCKPISRADFQVIFLQHEIAFVKAFSATSVDIFSILFTLATFYHTESAVEVPDGTLKDLFPVLKAYIFVKCKWEWNSVVLSQKGLSCLDPERFVLFPTTTRWSNTDFTLTD